MPDREVLVIYLFWAVLRWWRLKVSLELPRSRGAGWFLDVNLGPESADPTRLLRQYRQWMLGATIATELLAITDVVWFGTRSHLVFVQAPLALLLAAVRRLLTRGFQLRARELAEPSATGAGAMYSLKPREMADYSNGLFEAINLAAAMVAVGVIFSVARQSEFLSAFLILYLQGGLLLKKYALLQRPVALPTQGSEEYLQLAEESFQFMMRAIDSWRGFITVMLAILAVKVKLWDAWMAQERTIGGALLLTNMAAMAALIWWKTRRGWALLARAKKMRGPAVTRKLWDPENLHLGGLVYCNADNPAVAVDGGPLRFAVNVVNRNTYVYAGYWMGLMALLLAVAKRM